MKYFITLFMIIFGTFGYAQSRNTFYVQKKNNDEIKKVYFIGERVNLLYGYSEDSLLKVKGLINEISEDKIKVNEKWIEVSSIHAIIKVIKVAQDHIGNFYKRRRHCLDCVSNLFLLRSGFTNSY